MLGNFVVSNQVSILIVVTFIDVTFVDMHSTEAEKLFCKRELLRTSSFREAKCQPSSTMFCRAFVAVESSMLDMLSAVLRQLRWYLLVVVLTVYVFTVAVFVLFRLDRKPSIEDVVDYCKEECDPIQPWDKLKECKPWECNNGLCDKPETFKYCIPRPFLVSWCSFLLLCPLHLSRKF